jgi:hypothetical protein
VWPKPCTNSGVYLGFHKARRRPGGMRNGCSPVDSSGKAAVEGLGEAEAHKILMPVESKCVTVHERDTNKAVNIFHIKSTGKTNLFRLRIKIEY